MINKIKELAVWFLCAFILLNYQAVSLGEESSQLERIVVTSSRTPENIKGTTSDVTVLWKKDLDDANSADLKNMIRQVLGVDVVQTGSFGGATSFFLRGTSPGQSRIMIDNVRLYDPIAADAAYDMGHLLVGNIDRTEIVRGPQSVLYGSDAMGGVVNIITQKGEGRPRVNILLSQGTHNTQNMSLESLGRIDKLSYSFSASRYASDGISKLRNTSEHDPNEDLNLSLRAEYNIDAQNTFGITSRIVESKYRYDDSFGLRDDPNLKAHQRQMIFSNFWETRPADFWKQKLQLSYFGISRRDFDDKDEQFPNDYLRDRYKGQSYQMDWQNNFTLSQFDTLVCGVDGQRESGEYHYYSEYTYGGSVYSSQTDFPRVYSNTKGVYAENLLNVSDKFRFNTGIRIDDHSYAGLKTVYKTDASYLFSCGTKIKAGWGTAYKAPTLYQLHAEAIPFMFGGGNDKLQPEESQSYEFGFEQAIMKDKVYFSSVFFHTQLKNLIDAKYDPVTYYTPQYSNIGQARIYGYENSLEFRPLDVFKINIGYTWQDTEDKSNGDELIRRPRNKAFLGLNYSPIPKLEINLKLLYVGRRSDVGNLLLKAYNKTDLNINYKINKNFETFLNVDNLTSEKYREVFNYACPGRMVNIGGKIHF
ncbi:MAG: TonB-dependent receptor [Candidatus Omnitrophica bacterium]|nr:TonB-dependent receptor [Candidatus Omnitrophota bacterium]